MAKPGKKQLAEQSPAASTMPPQPGPVEVTRAMMRAEHYEGPIPNPEMLARYEDIYPGAVEWIFRAADEERQHRHGVERDAVAADIEDQKAQRRENRLGQYCALIIGALAILCGTAAAVYSQTAWGAGAGALIGGGGVIGLVTVFIYGRNSGATEEE